MMSKGRNQKVTKYYFCEATGYFFNFATYPKTCDCCNTAFNSRDQYLLLTTPSLTGGEMIQIGKNKMMELRNCFCESTLVTIMRIFPFC
jgi:hypothetical protein